MKNRLIALVAMLFLIFSCEKEPVRVDDITLDTTSVTLVTGEKFVVVATLSPSDAANFKVIWSSADASVARVSGGEITAIAPGKTTINAKSDDGGKTDTCRVTVVS